MNKQLLQPHQSKEMPTPIRKIQLEAQKNFPSIELQGLSDKKQTLVDKIIEIGYKEKDIFKIDLKSYKKIIISMVKQNKTENAKFWIYWNDLYMKVEYLEQIFEACNDIKKFHQYVDSMRKWENGCFQAYQSQEIRKKSNTLNVKQYQQYYSPQIQPQKYHSNGDLSQLDLIQAQNNSYSFSNSPLKINILSPETFQLSQLKQKTKFFSKQKLNSNQSLDFQNNNECSTEDSSRRTSILDSPIQSNMLFGEQYQRDNNNSKQIIQPNIIQETQSSSCSSIEEKNQLLFGMDSEYEDDAVEESQCVDEKLNPINVAQMPKNSQKKMLKIQLN